MISGQILEVTAATRLPSEGSCTVVADDAAGRRSGFAIVETQRVAVVGLSMDDSETDLETLQD